MGWITGKGAAVDGFPCISEWGYRKMVVGDNGIVCSASSGSVVRYDENTRWEAYLAGWGGTPPKLPGDAFTLTGSLRNGKGITGDMVVREARIYWPLKEGRALHYIVEADGNGAVTEGSYSVSDATVPAPAPGKNTRLKIDSVAVERVQYMILTLSCDNVAEVHSGSAGWEETHEGNVDCQVAYRQLIDDFSDGPALNAVHLLNLMVDASLSWEVKWGKIMSVEPKVVIGDMERRTKATARDVVARFTIANGGATGHLKTPAGASAL